MKTIIILILMVFCQIVLSQTAPKHFIFKGSTGGNATIAVTTASNPKGPSGALAVGDEIGVFDNYNTCCGAAVWENKNTVLTAWADDPQTTKKDGFISNETMTFRVWTNNTYYYARVKYNTSSGFQSGYFVLNGLYQLDSLTGYLKVAVEKIDNSISIYKLRQNYPNPFNPSTKIEFDIPQNSSVKINIFNIYGTEVKTLINKNISSGTHQLEWNGTDNNNIPTSSGIYFYKLSVNGNVVAAKKMILIR